MTEPRRRLVLGVVAGSVLMLTLDASVLFLAVPAITKDLGATAVQVVWIGAVYPLALAGSLITMGSVADTFGPRRVLLAGLGAFGMASLLAAFSSTPETLIAARLAMGLAGSAIMPSTLAIVRNLYPDAVNRSRGIAVWSAAGSAGVALGPLVGGSLLQHYWWGSVFLINIPVVAVLLGLAVLCVPVRLRHGLRRVDRRSAVLSIIVVVTPVYAIQHATTSGFDLVTLTVLTSGFCSGVGFVRRQRQLDSPMVDLAFFGQATSAGAIVVNFVTVFAITGSLFFLSQYLQLVRGFSPLTAGLAEIPLTTATLLAVAVVGAAASRIGVGRSIAAGLFLTTCGLLLTSAAASTASYLWIGVALVPIGLGVGVSMTLTTDVIVSSATANTAGSASAVAETAYQLGAALGIAVLGSLMTTAYRSSLLIPQQTKPLVRAQVEDSLATATHVLARDSPLIQNARHAFVEAIQTTSIVAAMITACAAIAAWLLIPARPTPGDIGDGG
jgi:DHA2 family multidrug resistance protein-like MFS transporter